MGFFRLITFLPMMLAPLVVGLFWRFLLDQTFGLVDYLITLLGFQPIPWLIHPRFALISVVIVDVWQWTPFVVLLALAGLGTVPADLLEAAALDRASTWMKFCHIYWPYLRFPLLLALLFRSIDTPKMFDVPFILTRGGPGNFTTTLSFLGYRYHFQFFQIGMAAASSWVVAMTQVARFYDLPVYINVGLSDSKRVDAQSGLERGMTLLMGALAGADTFAHMGIAGPDQGASLEQLIVDSEMAGYVKRLLRGFEVSTDTLALPLIEKVGIGGSFLAERHTRDHFRQEFWFPKSFDRRRWEAWQADGGKTLADWARERKRQILAEHQPDPVAPDLARELDRIVAAAAQALAG
jgi:ABC-type molybdate transport system permease subunit